LWLTRKLTVELYVDAKTTFIAKDRGRALERKLEQAPKATEAPKPKSRTMVLAVIIIAILVVVGVGVYILTLPTGPGKTIGARITIYDGNPTCLQSASPPDCGFKDSTGNSIVTITNGTTVEWTNTGGVQHTVTSCDPSTVSGLGGAGATDCPTTNAAGLPTFDSGQINSGGKTYQYTFNTKGTYYYFCADHIWMHGEIVVQ